MLEEFTCKYCGLPLKVDFAEGKTVRCYACGAEWLYTLLDGKPDAEKKAVASDIAEPVGQQSITDPVGQQSITDPLGEPEFVIKRGVLVDYMGNSEDVILPEGVTSIGIYKEGRYQYSVFRKYPFVKRILLPSSMKEINHHAFRGCTALESVVISDSVASIGEYVFNGCSSLTIHYQSGWQQWEKIRKEKSAIPESVKIVFAKDYVIENGVLVDYNGKGGNIILPEGITSIGTYREGRYLYNIFKKYPSVKSIVLPSSMKEIKPHAFVGCDSLEEITISDSVESIGESAFKDCSSLKQITSGKGVSSIGWGAFRGCRSLKSITIGGSVNSIGHSAFEDCSSLESVVIKQGVASIGDGMFYRCRSLKSVTIGGSVKRIGEEAFCGCRSLKTIMIPESVESIEEKAFFGSGLQSIHYQGGWQQWEKIRKERNATKKGVEVRVAKESVSERKAREVAERNRKERKRRKRKITAILASIIAGVFVVTGTVTALFQTGVVHFHEYVEHICQICGAEDGYYTDMLTFTLRGKTYCVSDCRSDVQKVVIPATYRGKAVTAIGLYAFSYSSLQSVSIPNSVMRIAGGAFDGCGSLRDVYYTGTKAQWDKIEMDLGNECLTGATIHYNS